ncbi:RNA-guided endonuclease InsQ/TnpB family protein [Streptomyces sp. BE133]|uniref:RNA-guided endonuclease InsQ/TnpB family protein n=1 Tax=Streptomyces sp. BE133 TaxID=3002523 RepID=UPI002E7727E9|nr:RNA-guided endonuclease TnpB family protein [Streptomyces sp. BE133]MEE1812627.1 RNA-guided endonuclease TnpB family protein [Streptomyces sp. BE133]
MQLRYNFRLYPTAGQRQALAQTFGCARVVYNDGLRLRKDAHAKGLPFPKSGDLSKTLITQAKRTPERGWLTNAPVGVMQQALRDLDQAYRNFFDSLSGKRKGPKVSEPRFKSKRDNRQTARYTRSDAFRVLPNRKLRLPKVGEVQVKWSRRLPSDPSSVTVIKDAAGRYFASFVVETAASEVLPETSGEVGIDLGLAHFVALSDGRKITAPKFFRRAERKLKKTQVSLARKVKGSSNRKKAVVKVAKAHAKVADARRDFHHKLSTTMIRENQAVYVEDLAVSGLGRTRLAKSVHDAGWSTFVTMLEYKATRYGRTFQRVDRMFPSSQLCSACGFKDGPKPLNVRTWTCQNCDTVHDRDVNAARNIKTEGKRIVAAGQADTQNARGAQVRPVLVPAPRDEAGTHPKRPAALVQWEQAGIPGL